MISAKPSDCGSIYDVAQKAGVSIGTVSRVFNNKQDVSGETRKKVLSAAKRVRYRPKISARRVSIGLVVQDIEKANEVGFISNTVSTLARHMASRGAILELLPNENLESITRNYIQGIVAVVFGGDCGPLGAIRDIPVVMINNRVEVPNFHMIGSDHAQGARIAIKHLLDRGHRRIGFLEVCAANWGAREREKGYRAAFEAAGVKPQEKMIGYVEGRTVKQAVDSLLAANPTALLVCGEDLSLAVNQILLHEIKVRIPQELSIVSYALGGDRQGGRRGRSLVDRRNP
jgi:DNA-binding LacI/PurR family transcriptional regulator